MPEGITLTGLLDGGATGLLSLLVALVFFGKLRPASAFTELREDTNARINEIRETANTWREAYETSEAARREQERALEQLMEAIDTTLAVVEAIRKVGDQELTEGGNRAVQSPSP